MTAIKQQKKRIPDFKSRQEMAEWFDNHDMTEYDFKPVKVDFILSKSKDKILVVRMQEALKKQLDYVAQTKGLNASSLARMWIIEKLSKTI